MDIYAHTFDQTNSSGTPYRYASATSIGTCPSADIENSTVLANRAQNLYGNDQKISNQTSCKPNTLNAGNYYSFPAATAGSKTDSGISYPYDTKNSICPKGWQLPPNSGNKSYNTLIKTSYGINSGYDLINSAISFINLGDYDTTGPLNRGSGGGYFWSSSTYNSTNSYLLYYQNAAINIQRSLSRAYGFSIRCVSR